MPATIDQFIEHAWSDQVEDVAGVAARLDRALPLLKREPARTGAFLELAEHVLIGRLGDADAMARWLDRLAPLALEHPPAAASLATARLAVALLREQPIAAHDPPRPVLIRAHGSAASGAAARGDVDRARSLLQSAESLADDAPDDAVKALAAVADRLAAQLLQGPRGRDADTLMMEAAELAQHRWHQAGTWLQAERAEHLLALGAAVVGDGARALRHAGACLSLCTAHGADAFERFGAHEALARASLAAGNRAGAEDASARMGELLGDIEDGPARGHAQSVWDKLEASLRGG